MALCRARTSLGASDRWESTSSSTCPLAALSSGERGVWRALCCLFAMFACSLDACCPLPSLYATATCDRQGLRLLIRTAHIYVYFVKRHRTPQQMRDGVQNARRFVSADHCADLGQIDYPLRHAREQGQRTYRDRMVPP